LSLASILREEGKVDDVRVIVAALLHDTIEDTDTDYDEIRGQLETKWRK
jgi:guanosine-3',5'-bis(diphosphate) 3'-pyrophosphohydrolase